MPVAQGEAVEDQHGTGRDRKASRPDMMPEQRGQAVKLGKPRQILPSREPVELCSQALIEGRVPLGARTKDQQTIRLL